MNILKKLIKKNEDILQAMDKNPDPNEMKSN
jgi:hypothetical protein